MTAAVLATGCLAVTPPAAADPEVVAPPSDGCIQPGPTLRYLVVFDEETAEDEAAAEVRRSCGTTTFYYPEISVAVAVSPDPTFLRRIGSERAYSAQGEALSRQDGTPARKKSDGTEGTKTAPANGLTSADLSDEQWDMALIRANEAHAVTTGSREVVVGVLDSGIDATHPDLVGALDPALSAGCLTGRPDPAPAAWAPTSSSHGTHVAGTIAAADDGRGTTGVAPGVRIAAVKVVDDEGFIYPEYAVCGFMWAAANGMDVTNNSYFIDPWAFTCQDEPGQSVVYRAVERAVRHAASSGVLNVAAAGNGGVDLSKPGSDTASPTNAATPNARHRLVDNSCLVLPAQVRGVVAVSSVGQEKVKSGYSSYGLGAVDVTAPGGDTGQVEDGRTNGCVLSTVPQGYDYSCGTSMAAPHASGVAALLSSTHPGSSPEELTRLLGAQADTLACPADYDLNGTGVQDAFCTGYSEYNGFYGHGLVDAEAAVENAPSTTGSTGSTGGASNTAAAAGSATGGEEKTPETPKAATPPAAEETPAATTPTMPVLPVLSAATSG
ncbi:S8 family peptidase [Umezawaea beigongshangensis]|uniref:S8 family peptidase n=1 Tax=Umezawaea beigongshangensis TaxID=2780383 RepID=UPI001E4E1564|nr:S8 family serine peptidase [Umezawaea beigongshangensis]